MLYSGTSEKGTLWGNGQCPLSLSRRFVFFSFYLPNTCFQYIMKYLHTGLVMITVSSDHGRSTYLNRNSIAVYRIMSCRLRCQCRLSTFFPSTSAAKFIWAPVARYAVPKPGSKFTLWSHVATPTKCPSDRDSKSRARPLQRWREERSTEEDMDLRSRVYTDFMDQRCTLKRWGSWWTP